ncbi:phenylacetate--CoA ligase family protein [Brachybacterium sp. AOP29-B2-41]|uniref:phenylacetate--CoA ligase family protein n=1 Tax=Brachybacterium sp. AOP29-B2-41 TaxID=3457704 RepID=UPI0040344B0C
MSTPGVRQRRRALPTARSALFSAKATTVRARSGRFLRELRSNERCTPQELIALQDSLACDIVQFAMHSSPYYRRVYGERSIDPARLRSPEAWAELPVLDRATVKEHSDEFSTPEATRKTIRPALTGGSTGEPLRTMQDARVPSLALSWRMYSWWGVEPYDDLARVARWNFGRLASAKNTVAWWPTRQVYLDAALISEETMARFQRDLTRVRPRLLEGYVGALLAFADFLEKHDASVPAPRAVATTAAPLTPSVRKRLEESFGAPVYDEYRGSEFGWTAGECARQDGLHVFSDVRRIEVLDSEGRPVAPGVVGDLAITDLRNRVFPLIRYRTGDRGALRADPCSCGSALPLMEPPDGRTVDVLRLPSGKLLAHRLMAMFSAHPDAVRQFQIHQLADSSITLRIVEGSGAESRRHIEAAAQELRERIDHEVPVRIDYVPTLPYTGGKTKYVISDVPAT